MSARTGVVLTPAAVAALGHVEQVTGASRWEIVCDALIAYAALVDIGLHDGAYRTEIEVDGGPLCLTACRTRPKRRWLPWN